MPEFILPLGRRPIEKKPCLMSFRDLVAVPLTDDTPLGYECGCSAVWTGEKWVPEHEWSPLVCVEPSHEHGEEDGKD